MGQDLRSLQGTYIALGEITTLEHEVGNHAVEDRTTITEVVLAGAELPEVPGSAGNSVVEQVENDLSGRGYIALQVSMFLVPLYQHRQIRCRLTRPDADVKENAGHFCGIQ